ncbi:MAG TPA: heterodisulfide reductase-related iron-sulfur binding cluster, partial [Candidatus Acidoferrales bacterium]
AFVDFKSAWDPDNKLNPGNIVNAPQPTEHLRMANGAAHLNVLFRPTRFRFPDDGGSMAAAADRCIGIGECRKQDAGVMCPSYMVTLEEEHSTRGRARMLAEALRGDVLRGGWNDEQVKRSLDLCLSCKACKSECPTNVDIATYRAEFLSHYYEGRTRPLHAIAFGLIDRWAQMASHIPHIANFAAHAPGLASLLRAALHVTPKRELPRFAPVSFQRWSRRHAVPESEGPAMNGAVEKRNEVILWADTFNNYFHPEVSRAALQVLLAAGFDVTVPRQHFCCGRPLYDFGMLSEATRYLERILQVFGGKIDAGVPIVVLEPSCVSVFRDELRNLFPADARAVRLRNQTFLLAEFLRQHAPDYRPPPLERKVFLHGHCHQKALLKTDDEAALLAQMGADVQSPDAGCCGMAGSFGYERDKFAVSQAIGERALLPAVRQASPDTLIVSDGFSCREQIRQATGRRAMHFAEVLQLALHTENREEA